MGLFKRKEKQQIEEKPKLNRNEMHYIIPYSKNFRGFKKFGVSVYGNETSEKNNKELLNKDLSKSKFEFVCFNSFEHYIGRMAILYIDGLQVGAVFDNDLLSDIENRRIEKIHTEPKELNERLIFLVKYKE